jgi:hypothetical protein
VPDVGQVSYLVKAVDVAGNESLLPAVIVANLGDPVVANILSTVDKKAGGFPGTLTGCSIVGGNLDAENTSTFWVDDLRRVWLDDAVTYWTQQYSEMSYITNTLPGAGDVPCTLILDLDVTGRDWSLWYRSAGTTLFWSGVDATAYWTGDLNPVWGPSSDFLPWPGQLPNATHQVYEFLFHAGAGTILTEITKYLVLLEVPDLVEALNDVVIAATTGTRLPIASTYRSISGVSLTLEDDGGTAVSVKFFDKNPSTGPLVKCFNAAGAVVAGLVDAQVHGY